MAMIEFPDHFADDGEKERYLRALRDHDAVVNLGNPAFFRLHLSRCHDISDPYKNWNPKIVFDTVADAVVWLKEQSTPWDNCGHCKPRGPKE